jgi:SSS family solute:Na+ symporter
VPVALTTIDFAIFLTSLVVVMAIGLWSGRKQNSSEDFFLAGKSVPWWGVAGSIFGTNVSAEHLVGMLGIGYSIGFAQSHFEYGAIAGLLVLAFVFLPLYRKMGLYTLSEYLAKRYDERSAFLYSAFTIITIVIVRMALGFYIGSRALSYLLSDTPFEMSYTSGILVFAVVTSAYTIFGGLKAVIWTDVIQSVMLLLAGIVVAYLVFSQPEIGGLSALIATDAALPDADQKFHLYLPSDHPQLPWSGVFSGLLIIHIFYWATNQFIAQRALAARSDFDAKMGIVAAGYLKLLVPFVSVATGIAGGHLFQARLASGEISSLPLPDDAFPLLVKLVVPVGYGLVGIITAGLIGAILSSIDSMMNSGATLFTFDFYKRYINPSADEQRLVFIGRVSILAFVVVAAAIAAGIYTEDAADNFFLKVPSQIGHIVPGIAVAFLAGVLWRGAAASGAFWAILLAPLFSFAIQWGYGAWITSGPLVSILGTELNFLHRTAITAVFALLVMVVLSRLAPGSGSNIDALTFTGHRKAIAAEPVRPFWRSERPWAYGLGVLTLFMLIYFA